jgi:hypothetical protein
MLFRRALTCFELLSEWPRGSRSILLRFHAGECRTNVFQVQLGSEEVAGKATVAGRTIASKVTKCNYKYRN